MNAAIAEAFPGMAPALLPRALTPAEQDAQRAEFERTRRPNLLASIRSYPEADVREALNDIGRKGWTLDGMSIEKLEELATRLRVDADEAADW